MSWRFRKSFKVIPGVKLNLTARGLSATIGAAPFSVNVGPRGVYRNIDIPGTGLWNRERVDLPSSRRHDVSYPPPPDAPHPLAPIPTPGSEIHSASTETLTTESLEGLRKLLMDAFNERNELTAEVATAESEARNATKRYQKWERGLLLKNVFKKSFASRKEISETATTKLEELREQLRLTTIGTEINIDHEQAEPYFRMRDKFAMLSESKTIWNVLTEQAIDRVAARSHASSKITRTPVSFSLGACDLLEWEQKVPHLPNRTGGDMYLYPGFVLYRASKQAFALIDFRDVILRFVPTQFTERDPIPADSHVVGHTWAKCNKDGSRDLRFRDNYEIPLARYGELSFSTRDGLDVRYLCSNAGSGEEFVKAWAAFQSSFHASEQKRELPNRTQHDDILNEISRTAQAHKRIQTAIDSFREVNDGLMNKITEAAMGHLGEPSVQFTISAEEFDRHASSLREVIEAAKEFENCASMASKAARSKYLASLQNLESKWTAFLSGKDGHATGDVVSPFLVAIAKFFQTQTEFSNVVAAATERMAKKH